MFLNFCSYSAFALISLLILVFEQKNYAQHDTLTCTSWVFLCMETAECKWILRTGATTCTTSLCCRKEHNLVNLNKQTDERKNNCTLALRITHSSVQSMAEYSNENSIDPSNGAASHIYHITLIVCAPYFVNLNNNTFQLKTLLFFVHLRAQQKRTANLCQC